MHSLEEIIEMNKNPIKQSTVELDASEVPHSSLFDQAHHLSERDGLTYYIYESKGKLRLDTKRPIRKNFFQVIGRHTYIVVGNKKTRINNNGAEKVWADSKV